jgi:SAM-dependent methyltransferase
MNKATARQLLALNLKFYQTFAGEFSETRQRLQPGVLRVIDQLPPGVSILDLGCGNGELARELAGRNFSGSYTGVDFSSALMKEARGTIPPGFDARFLELDLARRRWDDPLGNQQFDVILALAVFHHLPGSDLHKRVCSNVHSYLKPTGAFYLSSWQFLKSPRLRKRIQPWSEAGIPPDMVGTHDYLLDWRRGGYGLRYVHYFSDRELENLASKTGFLVDQTYHSDGKTGDLSVYQKWLIDPDHD